MNKTKCTHMVSYNINEPTSVGNRKVFFYRRRHSIGSCFDVDKLADPDNYGEHKACDEDKIDTRYVTQ